MWIIWDLDNKLAIKPCPVMATLTREGYIMTLSTPSKLLLTEKNPLTAACKKKKTHTSCSTPISCGWWSLPNSSILFRSSEAALLWPLLRGGGAGARGETGSTVPTGRDRLPSDSSVRACCLYSLRGVRDWDLKCWSWLRKVGPV